ncbi:MAG: hypothetical protein HC930_18285 [Hydrococcus sp. SU_1_0]|nr:hypothetical protein [Hydrococcus sp. SU_1_0]
MLPYALAIAVGLSSSILFLTAFFFKDIHRQDDFFWSGVGLFYALVLWFCATSISGAVLLGQLAVVALLSAYFWQLLKLRKAIANPETKESLDSFSVVGFFQNLLKRSPSVTTPEVKPEAKITTNNQQSNQAKPNFNTPASTVITTETEKKVSRADTQPIPKQDQQLNSFPEKTSSSATTKLNEILDTAESLSNSTATPSPVEKEIAQPKASAVEETKPPTPEVIRVENYRNKR